MTSYIEVKTVVSKVGKPEDYLNLPVVKDGNAVGIIMDAIEADNGYELRMVFFKKEFCLETINGVPSAISIEKD